MGGYFERLLNWMPALLNGLGYTILLSVGGMLLALVVGFVVAFLRTLTWKGPFRVIPVLLRLYVEILRGIPMIVVLFIVFFGLPAVNIQLFSSPLASAFVAIALNVGAYISESFRAAMVAVDGGQLEAALAMGIGRVAAYRKVVLPQAMIIAVPSLGAWFIALIKETSLCSFISVTELLRAGQLIVQETFRPFDGYITIGAIYLILSLIASVIVHFIVHRLTKSMRAPRHRTVEAAVAA